MLIKKFCFCSSVVSFCPESNKITLMAGQQHVNNCLDSQEKRISLFLYFPCIS